MSDVVKFTGISTLPIDPDKVLEEAVGRLELAIVVGADRDGNFYFASSEVDGAEVTWWLERAKYKLMQVVDKLEQKP
jgi:hypothetical protein